MNLSNTFVSIINIFFFILGSVGLFGLPLGLFLIIFGAVKKKKKLIVFGVVAMTVLPFAILAYGLTNLVISN